jgi:hypothetical protein
MSNQVVRSEARWLLTRENAQRQAEMVRGVLAGKGGRNRGAHCAAQLRAQ